MKYTLTFLSFLVILLTTLSGCSVIEGIFKAGVVVGVLFVIVILAIIGFIFRKISNRN